MRYIISEIRIRPGEGSEELEKAVLKKLKRKNLRIGDIKIRKESIDARRKPNVRLVYTVEFSCNERLDLKEASDSFYISPRGSRKALRPVVAGFGPCGIFAALILAEAGLEPLVLERGRPVDERREDVRKFWEGGPVNPESNVQFGEGGAGTFSDGKLTTGIKDVRKEKVLRELAAAGADESIMYRQKPHIGTDRLGDVVKNMRKKIEALGGEILFNTRLDDMETDRRDEETALKGLVISEGKGGERFHREIEACCLILASGHSGRDTFEMLKRRKVLMEQKPFSIGVRVEHPQRLINRVQYGREELAEILGAAEYKLSYRSSGGRGVYTFCMCPGGYVINASSAEREAVTNGMSMSARDGERANSGLLVDVRTCDFPGEDPLAGVEFQRKYEGLAWENGGGRLPKSSYGAFRRDREDPVRRSLPQFASEAIIEAMPFLGERLRGFDRAETVFTAVETRSSSPVRVKRDDTFQASIRGLFPAGEGAGYAGGIMSAAVDGIKAAEKMIEEYYR
ncbi:MAG TPA: NAD(FAD)-utilizing dehydrogenase [Candidatus Copromorpha excrementigallinarum]|uniref:NAD(FAD)-utilizing dehydrogenase n=1 Tax=Candidatus Allocopromorpha excrementigallinarum TaxID=2840742 RepID=A0A9D1HZ85_9FIRM|nr:NAD(FAD)-utilizing dehydrogenase [Candidatus Copromorpha excrementigallinarum]